MGIISKNVLIERRRRGLCLLVISLCFGIVLSEENVPSELRIRIHKYNPTFSDHLRLGEYFCQPNLTVNESLRDVKFLHLRGLTLPNNTGVSMEDMYSKAVNRLVEQVPHVKYVSLTAEYEYSADDAVTFEI